MSGSPKSNWSQGKGPDLEQPRGPYDSANTGKQYFYQYGNTCAPSWSQNHEGSSKASVWWPGLSSWGSAGLSQKQQCGAAPLLVVRKMRSGALCLGQRAMAGNWASWPLALQIGFWYVTFLAEKKLELGWEVEQYQLDIIGLTSMHTADSGIKLPERGWTLSFSRIAQDEMY